MISNSYEAIKIIIIKTTNLTAKTKIILNLVSIVFHCLFLLDLREEEFKLFHC